MKISFDLDDTLILSDKESPYEAVLPFPYSFIYKERLRKGTIQLFKDLSGLGCEIYVYTTSERTVRYIRNFFRAYGIQLSDIINQQIHQKIVQGSRKEIQPSKVPSRFGIHLHIDDDPSVKQNGVQHGFKVLVIDKNDGDWAGKVLGEAVRIRNRMNAASNR